MIGLTGQRPRQTARAGGSGDLPANQGYGGCRAEARPTQSRLGYSRHVNQPNTLIEGAARPLAPPITPVGERLAKRVAALLACSRRQAEQAIAAGWVRVDGLVVEQPQFRVSAQQAVELVREASLLALTPVTLLLHKPPGFDAIALPELPPAGNAAANPAARRKRRIPAALQLLVPANRWSDDSAFGSARVLQRHFRQLRPGITLEPGASGLVVFTQDWRIERKLTEDAGVLEQELIVEVAGPVSPGQLERLHHCSGSDGQPLPRIKASINSSNADSSRLRVAVKGTHPGLLAYLCQCVGLELRSLKRLRLGRVALGPLPLGQWRYLQEHERF